MFQGSSNGFDCLDGYINSSDLGVGGYLLNMIDASFMSRANTIVVPGGKMELAMRLIFTPFVWRRWTVERRLPDQIVPSTN